MSSEAVPKRREDFLAEFSHDSRPSPEQVNEQLQRILNSEAFIRSARIKRLLAFLVESVLQGQEDRLKESIIGAEVFDRRYDYDPKTDPIVRVEMRRGRSKLSEYYLSEGLGDPVLIWLDKGSYVPVLALRALSPLSPLVEATAALPPPRPESAPASLSISDVKQEVPKGKRLRIAALTLLALAGTATCLLLLNRSPTKPGRPFRSIPLTGNAGTELSPAFSPDSKQVAYSWDGNRGNLDIYVKQIGTGLPQRLTDNAAHDLHPTWSPDGKRIAFLRISPNDSQVVIIPASGGIETVIVKNVPPLIPWHSDQPVGGSAIGPVWSPDAAYLIVGGCLQQFPSCGLIKTFLDGRQESLTNPPGQTEDMAPAISPSHQIVGFVQRWSANSTDVFMMPLRGGGNPVRLTYNERDIRGVNWIDDKHLIYSSNQDGNYRLWQNDIRGGPPQPVPVSAQRPEWPALSPDGRWLAFVETAENASVWRLPIDPTERSSQPEPFLSSAGSDDSPSFDSNGRYIIFVSDRTGTSQLWLADSDGTNVRQLTDFPGPAVGTPRWSPNHQQIVFDASLNGLSAIWLIDSNGNNLHRLNNSKLREYIPSWSHDGQWVYYVSLHNRQDQLWKQRPDTGEEIQIADGDFLDAVEYPAGGVIYVERRNNGIWQIPLTGGKPEPVPELAGVRPARYWTLAKDKLYFVRQESSPRELDEFDVKSRQIRKIADIPGKLFLGAPGIAVDPDSHALLFVQQGQSHSSIVLQER